MSEQPYPNISVRIPTSKFDIAQLISTAAGLWLGPVGMQLSPVKPGSGVPKAEYILPSQETITDLHVLFGLLKEALNVTDDIVLAANRLYIAMVRSAEDPSLVFFRPTDFKKVHVSFMWRFGLADDMVIEDVHQGIDGTENSSPCIFLNTRARCMLINAIHPRSIHKEDFEPAICDAAHTRSTLYYLAHCMLANLYPTAFFVQLHGKAHHPPGDAIIMYNGWGRFTNKKSACKMLCNELQKNFTLEECNTFTVTSDIPGISPIYGIPITGPRDGSAIDMNSVFRWSGSGVDSIIEGRQLNGGNAASIGHDSGRFIILELDRRLKDKNGLENCIKLSKALNGVASMW